MARHQLIDTYLRQLARRLPADAVDELADGILEACQHHQAAGMPPGAAAAAAIAEFGDVDQVTDAFVQLGPGRRTARQLLATGPLVGLGWGAALITAHAWNWPVPTTGRAAFGVTLFATIAALAIAATSNHRYTRTRLAATAGSIGLIGLDTLLIGGIVVFGPARVWPVVIAASASLTRIGFTLRAVPRILRA